MNSISIIRFLPVIPGKHLQMQPGTTSTKFTVVLPGWRLFSRLVTNNVQSQSHDVLVFGLRSFWLPIAPIVLNWSGSSRFDPTVSYFRVETVLDFYSLNKACFLSVTLAELAASTGLPHTPNSTLRFLHLCNSTASFAPSAANICLRRNCFL